MIDLRTYEKPKTNEWMRRCSPNCPECGKHLSTTKYGHFHCKGECNQLYEKLKKESGDWGVGKKI